MDTQRLISDARRRARMLSRRDGRPLQTHLEEIAKAVGRNGWTDFLRNPSELAEEAPLAIADDMRWHLTYHRTMHWSTLVSIPGFAIIAAFIVLAPRFPDLVLAREDFVYQTVVLGSMLLAGALALASGSAILLTVSWWYARPRIARLDLAGVWGNVATRFLCVAAVVWGFVAYAPTMVAGPDPADAMSYDSDVRNARHVHVPEMKRDLPISHVERHGGAVDMEVVFIDSRLIPARMRFASMKGIMATIGKAHRLHPVVRFGGPFDCSTGRLHVVRIVAADTYASPARELVSRPSSKLFLAVSPPDVRHACETTV